MLAVMAHHSPLLVVTGVSGSGKTTLGAALAHRLTVPFADADDFHSSVNIKKMSAGLPLDDGDRAPWLRAMASWLAGRAEGGVLSSSALRRVYRDVLAGPGVLFVQLVGDVEVVRRRVADRPAHFMPASLVTSQFATLEPLAPDEHGLTLDLTRDLNQLVEDCLAHLRTADPTSHRPTAPADHLATDPAGDSAGTAPVGDRAGSAAPRPTSVATPADAAGGHAAGRWAPPATHAGPGGGSATGRANPLAYAGSGGGCAAGPVALLAGPGAHAELAGHADSTVRRADHRPNRRIPCHPYL